MDTAARKRVVRSLLEHAGTTYAEEAGSGLKDQPMPLFQLLTLCRKPIDATIATKADRADMIRAFGRAHYVRYDESSATRLADVEAAARLLKQFKGIGDTGSDIFLREIQDVWSWARPYFDKRAVTAARDLGLPADADELNALAPRNNAKLAAALVRVSLDDELRDKVAAR